MARLQMTSPEQGAAMELAAMGRRLVDMTMIGQDPSEGCVTYILVSERIGSDEPYRFATHQMMDWTSVDPERGFAVAFGHYMLPYEEALADARDRIRRLIDDYHWIDPFTGRIIAMDWRRPR